MSRTSEQIEEVAAGIEERGGRAIAVKGDVTSARDVDRCVAATESALGPLTLFVNNAGVPGPFGPIWEIDVEEWWASQAVHVRAPMLFLRRILPGMIARDRGRVIVVSALASRVIVPALSAYATGKIAQNKIVEEAAAEIGERNVKIFAINPGIVFTELARTTVNSTEAQRWLPGMVKRLASLGDSEGADVDLARCARLCFKLASGRFDALSGKYIDVGDDLDAMLKAIEST
jgi:NAD(P)-dependent dehydrogenase (short-subunit alcohol dehydrogenase family)